MIYHISTEDLFKEALERDAYKHPSLKAEGFIHCSTKQQMTETVAKHYPEAEEIFLLHIVESRLQPGTLKWEATPSRPEAGEFPHIYSAIPLDAIEDVSMHDRNPDGTFDFNRLPGKGIEVSEPDEEIEI